MKRKAWMFLGVSLILCVMGCNREGALGTTELEKAFPVAAQPVASAELGQTSPAPTDAPPIDQYVRQAVTAIRTSNYEEAVVTLQALRSASALTPEQLTAVQDTMGNLQTRLAELAERGDPKARQAMETLRQLKRR